MKITRYFKAFALSGRLADCYYTQGDCPGLGASALSGRVGKSLRANLLVHLTGRIRINPCLKTTRLLVLLPTLNLQVVLRECAESLDEGGG